MKSARAVATAPQLSIEWWPISRPKPYPANARKLSARAIETLAKSLKEFGWRQPIVVDVKDVIVAGHTRLMAAQASGMTQVPVHVARELTAAQIRAYRIMDNRSADETEWDMPTLETELAELAALEVDLSTTGFEAEELAEILKDDPLTDEDDTPPAPSAPVAHTGDLWRCGEHLVLCGDSTATEAVSRVCGAQKADMIFTDPPYGVEFGVANHNPRAKRWAKIANDEKKGADLNAFLEACFRNLIANAVAAAPAYVWSATMASGYDALKALMAAGFHVQSQIVWVKNTLVLGQADYQWKHEPCWYGWTPGKNHYWNGGRALTTIWELSKDANSAYLHPMQKPTALAETAINNSCPKGGVVLDVFGGSGSTLIACEKTTRRARLIELAPAYVDVIILRWQAFTGQDATLDGDGRTFAKIGATRKKK